MNESTWLTIALNTFICLTNSSWSLLFIKCSCISKVTTVLLSYYHPYYSRNPWWQPRVHMISFPSPCVVEGATCTHMCSSFVLFTHKVHYWHNYIVLSSPCLPEEPQRGEKEATPCPLLPPPLPLPLPLPLPPPYIFWKVSGIDAIKLSWVILKQDFRCSQKMARNARVQCHIWLRKQN